MEIEQWDNGSQNSFQPEMNSFANDGGFSHHDQMEHGGGYNYNDTYDVNNNYSPNNNYNSRSNYRGGHASHNNNRYGSKNGRYRGNNYRRNQYGRNDNNRGYNRRSRGRGRGGGHRNYNNNSNYRQRDSYKPYNYKDKRSRYQQRSKYQPKHQEHHDHPQQHNTEQMQSAFNPNDPSPMHPPSNEHAHSPMSAPQHERPGTRQSRPRRDIRFGSNRKKKGARQIEDDLDFELEDNDDDNDQPNDQQQREEEKFEAQSHLHGNTHKNQTFYAEDSEAQLYQTNRYSFHNNNNNNNTTSSQSQFDNDRPHRRRDDTLDLENMGSRAKKMTLQLKTGKYDCMVCHCLVGKKGRIWTCNNCHSIFHMTCINKWAKAREAKDAQAEQRAVRPDREITSIKCPACSNIDAEFKFDQYHCFCHKVIFDHEIRSAYSHASTIPHSCGDICGKKRGPDCPHTCPAECHPGPCEPCKLPSDRKSSCPCGKLTYSLLCGEVETERRLCNQKCGKQLDCGNHLCEKDCHHGACPPCSITNEQECFCGKEKKMQPCGTGVRVVINDENAANDDNEEKQTFVWKYSCEQKCGKLLSCGHHRCSLVCHNGSCSTCPRKIETPTRCACGKNEFPSVTRTSCQDELPTCDQKCGRMLLCGQHFCKKRCHDSKCSLCGVQMKKRCRCGATERKFKCHDYQQRLMAFISNEANQPALVLEGQDSWIRCQKKCKRVKSCGKHTCSEICCAGRNIRTYFDGHHCRELCNKKLPCGRHNCSSNCHRGRCNPCGVTYRNGVECACGRIYVPGPFQCGTKEIPPCPNLCNKYLPCGHLCVAKCHHGDCPPCNQLCSRTCQSHGIPVHNLPCHVEQRSCGNPCGNTLFCGMHKCQRTCHSGICKKEPSANGPYAADPGCGQICGLPLKCGHPCRQKCHRDTECTADFCKHQISVKCKCGSTSEKQYCRGRTEYELKAVPCTEECQIAQRNKRFAEALNIDVKKKNESISEQKEPNKTRIPFAAAVLKRILKWMQDDKGHSSTKQQDKKIIVPKFVLWMESVLDAYISDSSQDGHVFKQKHPDVTLLTSTKSEPIINLKPMNSEQRYIVFSMQTHYHVRVEKRENSGKNASSYLEISKRKQSRVPDYLLSTALMDYQQRPDEMETLESMPPSSIIVIDNAADIASSSIQDRLLAWTGDYRMWRNQNDQLFIVFTDENARNSAMTEVKRFGGRKATKADSMSASAAQKKNQQRKKKKQQQKQKEQQQQQPQFGSSSSTNSDWITKGNPHAVTSELPKYKTPQLNVKMGRF